MSEPISPAPVTEHAPDFLPAYLSNGVIGLRVREIPFWNGVAVVNGLAGVDPTTRVESAPYAPYPLGGDIKIGHVWLSDLPRAPRLIDQTYDFSCGELTSRFAFTIDEVDARVRVLTFCSRSHPYLVLQEIQAEFNQDCDVVMRVSVDPNEVAGEWLARTTTLPDDSEGKIDGVLLWSPYGDISTCGAAYTTQFLGDDSAQRSVSRWDAQGPLTSSYQFRAVAGKQYRLRQITALVPSPVHHQPDYEAARRAGLGQAAGFDTLRQENKEHWTELWKGRVQLLGAPRRWQAMADAAYFYLHSSVHPSSIASTHIFGLARWHNYHYYYGHVMWDVETFAAPPLLLTQPNAARAMLEYRKHCIPAARNNARLYGYMGLQYPWQSTPMRGEESTPPSGAGSGYEQHVGLGVAHSFVQYYYATGDEMFLRFDAWPVIQGVAEWIASRVTKTGRGYEILKTMGTAERPEPSNNVAYVNMGAAVVLREAIACAKRLGYSAPTTWADIASRLVVPLNEKTNVILSHDGYRPNEKEGATPEALAAITLFNDKVDEDVERATLRYYLDMADDYLGTPMLSAFYGLWAARLGDRAESARLFEDGYATFVSERFMNVHELPESKFPDRPMAGPFFANIGGFISAVACGLPGLRIGPGEPDTWCDRPVVMPEGWDGVEIERLTVRGQPAHLIARHGDEKARLEILPSE